MKVKDSGIINQLDKGVIHIKLDIRDNNCDNVDEDKLFQFYEWRKLHRVIIEDRVQEMWEDWLDENN